MENKGIKNVSKNVFLSIISNIVALLIAFIVRKIFLMKLGSDFVGLNSLFVNILGILSFAELGIGVAVTASLYEPIQQNNSVLLRSYLDFYRKFMNWVAIFIELAGIIVGLIIPMMIHGHSGFSAIQLWWYFFLFTTASAASYVLTYKRILLTADQNDYLNSLNNLFFKILIAIFQIIVLIFWESYVLYLVIQITLTLVSNISISFKIKHDYPTIFEGKNSEKITPDHFVKLKKNITGMISAKLGGIILTSTDNIIISFFLGLSILGKYANYIMIVSGITLVLNQIFNSLTPTVGNHRFVAEHRKSSDQLQLFKRLTVLNYALVIVASAGFSLFSSIFVKYWLGTKFILPADLMIMIVLNFAINQYRQVVIMFMSAYGLFWQQRYKSVIEAVLNISLSLVLIKFTELGIFSVIFGTLATNICFNLFWEFYITKKDAITTINTKSYFMTYICAVMALVLIVYVNSNLVLIYQNIFSDMTNFLLLAMSFLIETLIFSIFATLFIKNVNNKYF